MCERRVGTCFVFQGSMGVKHQAVWVSTADMCSLHRNIRLENKGLLVSAKYLAFSFYRVFYNL